MARPRFDRLPTERQRCVLDAAAAEFASCGFDAASYNRIIASAGISKGAMYYYFDDKADLFATVIQRAVADVFTAVGPLTPVGDADAFWHQVEAKCQATLAVLAAQPRLGDVTRAAYGEVTATPTGPLAPLVDELRTAATAVLMAGASIGAVRDDLPADLLARVALCVGVAVDTWLVEQSDRHSPEALAHLGSTTANLLRAMLGPGQARR